ncbi:MAG: PAS domain S-box protein [Armatimonadetes bacterium]|nr:PAS domain S-box protein [Armatimonadota bacterium]
MSEWADVRGLCETIPHAALLLDSDSRIAYANPAARELFGFCNGSGEVSWLELSLDGRAPEATGPSGRACGFRTPGGELAAHVVIASLANGGWIVVISPSDSGTDRIFRRIIDATQDLVFIIGRDDQIEYVNEVAANVLGRTAADLIGQPRSSLFPQSVAASQRAALAEAFETGRSVSRESCIDLGTRHIWLDTRLVPLLNESGNVVSVLGVSRDVSARREAEAALRASEDTAWALLNASNDLAILVDPDWRILAINDACARTFGKRVEDLVGTEVYEHMDASVVQLRRQRGEMVLRTRQPARFEETRGDSRFLTSIYPVLSEDGTVTRLAVYVHDITERRQAEQRQRLMASGLRSLVAIADELLQCDEMDALLRKAVELPREALGLDRCSVYLTEGDHLRGTYGTHLDGSTSDERELRIPADIRSEAAGLREPGQPRWTASQGALVEWDGREMRDIGPGWTARTQIRAADRVVGIFYNDNARQRRPLDPVTQELVAVYCSFLGNIIERKRAEQALRSSEERLRKMAELMPAVFWMSSVDGRRLEYISPAFERLTGRPAADFLNREDAWLELVHPADRRIAEYVLNAESADELDFSYRIIRANGEVRMVNTKAANVHDETGRAVQVIGFTVDITDRQLAEDALRASEQRFRSLFDATNEGLLAVGIATERILTANPAFSEMIGYTTDELLTMGIRDIHPPESFEDVRRQFHAMASGELSVVKDVPVLRRDRSVFYADISARRVELDGISALLGVFHDVTERRRIADAQRLAAIGQLAAGVAHEFNNLLASMMLAAELAEDRRDPEGFSRLTEVVLESTARGAEICHNLVTFARPREPMRIPVTLEQAIDAALSVASRQLEISDVTVVRDYRSGGVTVMADPGQLEQVFLNLIINACHAMPVGGVVTLRTRSEVDGGGGRVAVADVVDTGTGIKPEHMPHIFEPFFTTKGVRGDSRLPGSGLGLSVSLGIMRGHGGTLEASSTWGRGSTFTLRIPACTDEEARSSRPGRTVQQSGAPVSGLRVLVAEDEPGLRELITDVLTQRGHVVVTVASGDAAAESLRSYPFDALVTDLVMPGGGGVAALQALRDLDPRPIAIVVTGRIEPDEEAMSGLADVLLAKPFSVADLVKRLEDCAARRQAEPGE